MTDTLVDSSVVIDIAGRDPIWFEWSSAKIVELGGNGDLLINQIIFAESILSFRRQGDLRLDADAIFVRRDLPWGASELAAHAHADGPRTAILADFLIAAHAQSEGLILLTRDPARAKGAFPDLQIVAPER